MRHTFPFTRGQSAQKEPMGFFSRLFGSRRPNIAKLKQANDLNGLRAALTYSGKDEVIDIVQINTDAARALADLGDRGALPELKKALAEMDSLDRTIREILEIVTNSETRERSQRERAAVRSARDAIVAAIRRLE
jgi:hypothetical protein